MHLPNLRLPGLGLVHIQGDNQVLDTLVNSKR
jgi:hypothetical protein